MNDHHSGVPPAEVPPAVSADLRALRDDRARDLPTLAHSVNAVRSRRGMAQTWKERWMSTMNSLKHRPLLTAAGAAVAIVIALLVIPISYERTTGHDVTLTLANVADPSQIGSIAAELKQATRAGSVSVEAANENGEMRYAFAASVPNTAGVDAQAVADAFVNRLNERGFQAVAAVKPVKERVSGSVYAYAKDLVIEVKTDGKTAAQIEAEIEQRLAEAGVQNAQVTVTDESGNRRKVTVEMERHADGTQAPGEVSLTLTKDGKALGGEGMSVQVKRLRTTTGETLHLDVRGGAKATAIDIPNANTLTDAAIQTAVESQLKQAGFNVKVTVTNGQVQIEKL